MDDAEWTDTVAAAADCWSTLGKEPPERKEGHSERSSGSEEAGCLPMNDRIAAAYGEKKGKREKVSKKREK